MIKKTIKRIMKLGKRISGRIQEDAVAAYAAQTAFFIILSFIPFLVVLLTMIKYLPFTGDDAVRAMMGFLPPAIHDFIAAVIDEVFQKTSATLLSISVITALWSASKGFMAIIRGLSAIAGKPVIKNYVLTRILSVFYTLIFSLVLLLTLLLFGFGNQIYLLVEEKIPFLKDAAFLIISLRTAVFLLALFGYFLFLYVSIPRRKKKLRDCVPGAFLSAGGWLGFSYLYSVYIDRLSDYSAMYGSLTAVVLCMVWLYFCMYIMFIGAEVNVFLEHNEGKLTAILHKSGSSVE